ncbi:MAG: DUF3792 family protein [Candidatus Krumholzibacteria bacterium]|jgi:hypothetical protein|nr:DUF3792 family protein [Candidatus Krumholzibacteria bacterium]MDP6669973.1 DUF3792 family protein [Candidatus Krumholzibacteria bacterium]MDP6797159.1 DUF3792 family protein [Candidatus Krumholzibacteria bacterium]MDP7022529.1 DUF3792 family protein [Candidatus Krumholzibacteria bacterium]
MREIRFLRILLTALAVTVISIGIVTLVITGYGMKLAVESGGTPDQAMIETFVAKHASWMGSVSSAILLFLGAFHVARKVPERKVLNAFLVGVFLALLHLKFVGEIQAFPFFLDLSRTLLLAFLGGMTGARK